MLRLAALILAFAAPLAHAETTTLRCNGQELGIGDTANRGPIELKINGAKVSLKWENSTRALVSERVVCGDVLPEQPSCMVMSEEKADGTTYLQSCGEASYRRGLPQYSSSMKLKLDTAKEAGRFSCNTRTGADILIELSSCR